MKTVQEWLVATDEKEIIDAYQWIYPPEFWRLKEREISVSEVYGQQEEAVSGFIKHLKCLAPTENENMLFLAISSYQNGNPEVSTILVDKTEIDKEPMESYGWFATDREEIMGYHIADTQLTKQNMPMVLAQILYEASFLGFTREQFEAERDDLNHSLERADQEIREGKPLSADEVWYKLCVPRENKGPRAEEQRQAGNRAEHEYAAYSQMQEIRQIKSLLRENANVEDID